MYCQRSFRHTKTDSLSGLTIFRGCVVFILTYLKAARFHLAGKNPPPPCQGAPGVMIHSSVHNWQ